ncbi:hypothetical protein ACFSQ3_13225 [Sphingobacterium corticis]|uniref:DUF4440 domain-containing protein n=1 Tax=Sphingobacterium corticis TaxID=1812823 RepID=A0ABW5NMM1_9SPHI
MSKLFLIICLSFWGIQDDANKQIYSAVLNQYTGSQLIVLKGSTSAWSINDYNFDYLKTQLVELERETFDAFITANKNSVSINRWITFDERVASIDSVAVSKMFSEGGGWGQFYEEYKGANGMLTFSKIGFNKDETQALIYFEKVSDYKAGVGKVMLFRKSKNSWKSVKSTEVWIS